MKKKGDHSDGKEREHTAENGKTEVRRSKQREEKADERQFRNDDS